MTRHRAVFLFEGEDLTVEEIAQRAKIPTLLLFNRLTSLGTPVEVAIERIRQDLAQLPRYPYQGQDYTIEQLFRHPDRHPSITRNILNWRIKIGHWAIEKALKQPLKVLATGQKEVRYPYQGELLPLREIYAKAKLNDISVQRFREYVRLKYPEHSIEAIIRRRRRRPEVYFDVLIDGVNHRLTRLEVFQKAPRSSNVDDTTLHARLRNHRADPERYPMDWCLNAELYQTVESFQALKATE